MLKFYGYKNCDSCRNAEKFLKSHDVPYEFIDVTLNPPSAKMLLKLKKESGIDVKKFLNTSGEAYRSLGLKEKLPTLNDETLFEMLAGNGRLIKRPLITDGTSLTLGFKAETMTQWV